MAREFTEKRQGEVEIRSRKERCRKVRGGESSSTGDPQGIGLQPGIAQAVVERSVRGGGLASRAKSAPEPIDADEADSRPVGGEGEEVTLRPAWETQEWGVGSKDDPELSPLGVQNLEVEPALMCPDWLPWPNVQPNAQPNEDCPRAQAVEGLLNSDRGWGWVEEISKGLRLHPNLQPLPRSRIRFLLMRGDRVAMVLGMVSVDERLRTALDALRGMFCPASYVTPPPPLRYSWAWTLRLWIRV